jgi:hypothetical protein
VSQYPRHLDEDDCLSLVHGLVDDATKAESFAHARECDACAERLLTAAGDRERFRAREARARLREQPRVGAPWRWLALGGTLAAAALVASWFFQLQGPTTRGAEGLGWLPDATSLLVTRDSGSSTSRGELEAGLQAYQRRDVKAARSLLSKSEASGRTEQLRRAYLASALAWSDDFAGAASALEGSSLESLPEPWRSECRLVLAISWQRTGRSAEADSLLSVLAAGDGSAAERARALRASGQR